ncbi:MAG: type VI secretion system baseplate subunit TssG, partial [Archangium sp.]|nr:type VI secretion system baseplate subunit TssG [Archangium sp.]
TTRFEVETTFLGLTGSSTPLPLYFTEEILHEDEGVQRAFLDLFHHRLLSLLYRATVKYRLAAEASVVTPDAWIKRLVNLAGLDLETTRSQLPLGATLMLLPALAATRRSPAMLEAALTTLLSEEAPGARVRVEPFSGAWSPIDERDLARLGQVNTRLGVDAVLGSRTFDPAAKFRIEIGPVDQSLFRRLSEGGDLRATVDATVALFVNDWLAYDLAVTVDRTRVSLRLSATGEGSRLGVDSWLGAYDADKAAVRISTSRKATATR